MESACTGVGSVKPRFSMASNEGLDKPSVLKVEVVMPFSVGDGRAIVYAEDKQWYTFPMHLMPLYLNMYAQLGDWEMCEKYHILDCIECGACSYLCPGRQHPVQNLRVAKQKVLELRRKAQSK